MNYLGKYILYTLGIIAILFSASVYFLYIVRPDKKIKSPTASFRSFSEVGLRQIYIATSAWLRQWLCHGEHDKVRLQKIFGIASQVDILNFCFYALHAEDILLKFVKSAKNKPFFKFIVVDR